MANESVTVENPYGLQALWSQGDFVAKGMLIILVVMSLYSWYIIFTKCWDQRRLLKQAAEADKNFWSADNIQDGVGKLTGKGNIFKAIASEAIDAAQHHEARMTQEVPLHEWIDNVSPAAWPASAARCRPSLPFLATVGSTAPFVGLFGTVWGIYHALVAIGVAGQASIDKVAGPVGEALIMTAIGLAVAVPAVLGYNWLLASQQGASMESGSSFATDLQPVMVSGARVEGTNAAAAAAPARPRSNRGGRRAVRGALRLR